MAGRGRQFGLSIGELLVADYVRSFGFAVDSSREEIGEMRKSDI